MKKIVFTVLGLILVVGLVMAAMPSGRDEIHWRWASYVDEAGSYGSYVASWPAGRHAREATASYDQRGWAEAQKANSIAGYLQYAQLHSQGQHVPEAVAGVESLHWREASGANTVAGFERYLKLYVDGKHSAEAAEKMEALDWQETTEANTIRSFNNYLQRYPQGKHRSVIPELLPALKTSQKPYLAALKQGTGSSLQTFLTDYPGHVNTEEVRRALKEITTGRDIVDLIRERKIEVDSQGSGIESVSLRVRKRVPYALTVHIPVGTFMVSANPSAQNMVTTAATVVRLETDEWQDVSPEAACANRPLDIPGSEDKFTVQRSPHQEELARLMPVLGQAGADTETRQAAVWIVTDDADYDDLGTLVNSSFGIGGSRVINELEAAKAMKVCADAGIDITGKRIWNDKQSILEGLTDDGLKKWLAAKK
jgi:hypothetical protein